MDSDKGKLKRLKLSFIDGLIGIFILAFSLYLIFNNQSSAKNDQEILIFHHDKQIDHFLLQKDHVLSLDPHGIHMVIETKEGSVRVKSSDCPQQICVKKGWTRFANDPIICMPNHIMVIIEGGEAQIDAITQ